MKDLKIDLNTIEIQDSNHEISCGNCWGHQQYEQGYREQKFDYWRGRRDNFISRFVKKYLR
jgi:hypothetical protein